MIDPSDSCDFDRLPTIGWPPRPVYRESDYDGALPSRAERYAAAMDAAAAHPRWSDDRLLEEAHRTLGLLAPVSLYLGDDDLRIIRQARADVWSPTAAGWCGRTHPQE